MGHALAEVPKPKVQKKTKETFELSELLKNALSKNPVAKEKMKKWLIQSEKNTQNVFQNPNKKKPN